MIGKPSFIWCDNFLRLVLINTLGIAGRVTGFGLNRLTENAADFPDTGTMQSLF
ncbi:hypothetical protein [Rhizobium leguminosarum]|uniref:hypothetical protein n=1 Tax=Rhizobium leguminosarum TaxID=384 RepID=UPI001441920E|nr:hypothetical protein [Rhizobium leguminosarum]